MPNTFKLINSVTVGAGGASTIDFTSIPATYTDLCVKVSGRKTTTGGSNLQMQFNGSTSGYTQRTLIGNTSTVNSYVDTSEIGFMYVTISSDTANTFSTTDIYISNYTGSNSKAVGIENTISPSNVAGGLVLTSAVWANSAAINRVYLQLANGAGVFAQHSTAHLYGIVKQ